MHLDFFIKFILLLRGRGVQVNVFFFVLYLTCGRRRGRGLSFFSNFFFIVEWLRRGVKVFLILYMLKGDGRGRGGWREEDGEGCHNPTLG